MAASFLTFPREQLARVLPFVVVDAFESLWQAVAGLLQREGTGRVGAFVDAYDVDAFRETGASNVWTPGAGSTLGYVPLGDSVILVIVEALAGTLTMTTAGNDARVRIPDGFLPSLRTTVKGYMANGGVIRQCTVFTVADDAEIRIARDDANLATDAAFNCRFIIPIPVRIR